MNESRAQSRPWLALFAVLIVACIFVYRPSFSGGPISDDVAYLMNPWVTQLRLATVPELLDPRSQATLSLNNYAPVRPLLHGVQWRLFYDEADIPGANRAYHVTNVVAHAIAAGLLGMLLAQVGLPFAAAAAGAGFFALHPANVESVAWICELWTSVALLFGIGALLAQRRRPAIALFLFALALLTKPQVVCVLPVALLRQWVWRAEPDASRGWRWMGAWLAVFAAVIAAELITFVESSSAADQAVHRDALVVARTVFALAGRYFAMGMTGYGVATFQQPPPAVSWLDPWWLFGLASSAGITALAIAALRARREEAAFWVWGPAAFLPVSQLFPFLYPFADRYLYFMLPGLIGGALLLGQHLATTRLDPARRRALRVPALVAVALVCAGFGFWSHQRAAIWVLEDRVLADAARRWPEGVPAGLLSARRAARAGDADTAVAQLERIRAQGWDYYNFLEKHPDFEPIRGTPRFQALIRTFAGDMIVRASRAPRLTQLDLKDIAEAHRLRGEVHEALAAAEKAAALGGPVDAAVRPLLVSLRAQAAKEPR
jgi:hypothetical protein